MRPPRFSEAVGALGFAAALTVVAYAALFGGDEQALGALISVVAAGVGFFLRGKVENTPR
jgi:uncharacterized membrane protein